MSGDQEPWVFRGGLTADLQVGRQDCACERANKAQAAACVRASQPGIHCAAVEQLTGNIIL